MPTSSSCGGLQPSDAVIFCLSGKKGLIMLFRLILGHFWCPVVLFETLSMDFNNFEKK